MDISQAKTFLSVAECGSFVDAGRRLNITQSTVSSRIKTLELQLGRTLFERSKAGASLTPAGEQFLRHAEGMVRIWEHARLEIALPEGYAAAYTVGGQYSLWDGYMLDWLSRMRSEFPDVAIKAQMGFSDTLMDQIIGGTLDLGVMYTPQRRSGIEVEPLFEDELILVTPELNATGKPDRSYVLIDWGPEFLADHARSFPEISLPGTHLEIGSLSLQYLINTSSSGYVPKRLAAEYVESGQLVHETRAPVFSYPAFAVYPADTEGDFTEKMLRELRRLANLVNKMA